VSPLRAVVYAPALVIAVLGTVVVPASAAVDPSVAAQIGLTTHTEGGRARFVGRVVPLPAAMQAEMRGTTWRPGCPVPLADLRLLALSYWGFDARPHVGPLVVNASVADDIVWVFRRLFESRFPIHNLRLAREFNPSQDDHDTPADPSAAFNCRPVVTPSGPSATTFSQHAYGLAVDINPIENPFVLDGYVRNRYSRPYRDRTRQAPGMVHEGDVVVRSFAAIGWGWGGNWSNGQDYMHFSQSGT
jgi:D-alanyl-D-alanine carboxypeptidase